MLTNRHLYKTLAKFAKDAAFRRNSLYARHLDKLSVNDKSVLYEYCHGDGISDSPAAIFRELLSRPSYRNFEHIWALRKDVEIPQWVRRIKNVRIVRLHTVEYAKALASCKYLVNSHTFPSYFIRRPDQIYINTWHGTPIKTLGKHERNNYLKYLNIQRNFAHVSHFISPNRFTTEAFLESLDLDHLFPGHILESGSPRIDLTLSSKPDHIRDLLQIRDSRKILLYAPTWRGDSSNISLDTTRLHSDIDYLVRSLSDEYHVLVRVHPFARSELNKTDIANHIVSDDIETNALLSAVDVLISDYSSIVFDFYPTKKPVVFYAYDHKSYQESRGLFINIEDLPGSIAHNIEDVVSVIKDFTKTWDPNSAKLLQSLDLYNKMDDGSASARAIDFIFEGKHIPESIGYKKSCAKKTILLYTGGWLNNGISTSLSSLLHHIDLDKYNVVLADYNKLDAWGNEKIKTLDSRLIKFFKVGGILQTIEEKSAESYLLDDPDSNPLDETILSAYRREFKRIFGYVRFDAAIDFCGYSRFWSPLICSAPIPHRTIYLHNEMKNERDKVVGGKAKHYTSLSIIFRIYKKFDATVCVSEETLQENLKSLGDFLDVNKSHVVFNTIDVEAIQEKKERYIPIKNGTSDVLIIPNSTESFGATNAMYIPMFAPDDFVFMTIGRLSSEKDHEKLLNALSRLHMSGFNRAKLMIIGDGALRDHLLSVSQTLNLNDHVAFLGQIPNPLPLLEMSDCFVLSSNYEGQPMVLLEALVLGKPIVSTNIPGTRGLLSGTGALLVNNDTKSLADGMIQAIGGNVAQSRFDFKTHNDLAMQMFYEHSINAPSS